MWRPWISGHRSRLGFVVGATISSLNHAELLNNTLLDWDQTLKSLLFSSFFPSIMDTRLTTLFDLSTAKILTISIHHFQTVSKNYFNFELLRFTSQRLKISPKSNPPSELSNTRKADKCLSYISNRTQKIGGISQESNRGLLGGRRKRYLYPTEPQL